MPRLPFEVDEDQLADFPLLTQDLSRVETTLIPEVHGRPSLTEMVQHLFPRVAKLVRPTLLFMSHYLCRDPDTPADDRAIEAATMVEFLHVGTLCHDDVMDEADRRRDRPSVNARWGNVQAILSGNFLLGSSVDIAARLGRAEAGIVAFTFTQMCRGQMIETEDLFDTGRTDEAYLEAITGKTAVLLGSACQFGALEADASDAVVESFRKFGLLFGIAFQINDDILDFTEDAETLGKPAGKDALEGVYTLPLLRTMEKDPSIKARLSEQMTEEDVQAVRASVTGNGGLREAADSALAYYEEAELALAEAGVAERPGATALRAFCRGMLTAADHYASGTFAESGSRP